MAITAGSLFRAEVKYQHLVKAFERAPADMAPIVRDQVFRIVAGYRKRFIQRTEVDFKGGPHRNFPLVDKPPTDLSSGPKGGNAKRIWFVVQPGKNVAVTELEEIEADVFSVSAAWERLEEGGTFRATGGGKLALPIGITLKSDGRVKSQWNTPERFKRANKSGKAKVLVAIQNRKNGSTILYWQKPVGRGKNRRYAYLPAFLLVDKVTQPEVLNFYDTWDSERGRRTKVMEQLLQKMVNAIGGKEGERRG